MIPETILIRARVIEKQEQTLTVILEDGYGHTKAVVHEAAAIAEAKPSDV